VRLFHRNWVPTTGRVLDSRIRKMWNPKTGSGTIADTIALHSYVVEFQAPSGETRRLEVEQRIETIDVQIGTDVPLLVSPDGTKAIFDDKDPRINVVAVDEAQHAADKDRFQQDIDGSP
jgi:hypothetical protein